MTDALSNTQIYEFEWEDADGAFTARITGKRVWPNHDNDALAVYVTSDKRILAVYSDQMSYHQLDKPGDELVENLRGSGLESDEFVEVCRALGIKPIIDL